ncbi:MAG: hypothetical protein HC877_13845 [Thioploca sp.]|nr:hypothetical protein [Thioploca sp.]
MLRQYLAYRNGIPFENIAPVANAGVNQSVVQGNEVCFDGSNSSDVNGDSLSYFWTISLMPNNSSASLDNSTSVAPCMITDVAGSYEVSLTVNDGLLDSTPSSVNVVAITYSNAITDILQAIVEAINETNPDVFKNKELQKVLSNQVNIVIKLVDQRQYSEALSKLSGGSILGKINSCAESGEPDKNDWIQDCVRQELVHDLVIEAIGYLGNL